MTIITIPKELTKTGELVVIPRQEYNKLLKGKIEEIKEVNLTLAQKKVITAARKRITRGEFLTFDELKTKLGFKD
ncbi:MAG: hypothetical protein HYS78_01800 [Parcubacteria group bacterium]|nr:hypothetical protein [Parcubacteria group bacterium]